MVRISAKLNTFNLDDGLIPKIENGEKRKRGGRVLSVPAGARSMKHNRIKHATGVSFARS